MGDKEYNVGISNRYAFLISDDEEEEEEVVVEEEGEVGNGVEMKEEEVKGSVEEEKKDEGDFVCNQKPPKPSKTLTGKSFTDDEDKKSSKDKSTGNRQQNETREEVQRKRTDSFKKDENNKDTDDWGVGVVEDKGYGSDSAHNEDRWEQRSENKRGGGGRGRGPRIFRRGGGGGVGSNRRREYDRISGSDKSGVKPVDKRYGAGANNWGTYKDDYLRSDETVENDERPRYESRQRQGSDDDGWGPPRQENGKPADGETIVEDQNENDQGDGDGDIGGGEMHEEIKEEPKLMTLEEWKATQKPKPTPTFNIRKANEGEDPSKWKGLAPLKKKEDLGEEEFEYEEIWVPQRAGRQKLMTDVGFHFQERGDRWARRQVIFRHRENLEKGSGDDRRTNEGEGQGDRYPRRDYDRGRRPRDFRGGRNIPRGTGKPPSADDPTEFPSLT